MIESRAYDDEHADPVVVLVFSGTHDVSRAINLLSGASPNIEHLKVGARVRDQIRRHAGGRAAMRLLAAHGGPNFLARVGGDRHWSSVSRRRRALRERLTDLHVRHQVELRTAADGDEAAAKRVSAIEAEIVLALMAAEHLYPRRSLGLVMARLAAGYLGALSAMDVRPGLITGVQRAFVLAESKGA